MHAQTGSKEEKINVEELLQVTNVEFFFDDNEQDEGNEEEADEEKVSDKNNEETNDDSKNKKQKIPLVVWNYKAQVDKTMVAPPPSELFDNINELVIEEEKQYQEQNKQYKSKYSRLILTFDRKITSLNWHKAGDYFVTISSSTTTRYHATQIHRLSTHNLGKSI